jgi:hypothetical protein
LFILVTLFLPRGIIGLFAARRPAAATGRKPAVKTAPREAA